MHRCSETRRVSVVPRSCTALLPSALRAKRMHDRHVCEKKAEIQLMNLWSRFASATPPAPPNAKARWKYTRASMRRRETYDRRAWNLASFVSLKLVPVITWSKARAFARSIQRRVLINVFNKMYENCYINRNKRSLYKDYMIYKCMYTRLRSIIATCWLDCDIYIYIHDDTFGLFVTYGACQRLISLKSGTNRVSKCDLKFEMSSRAVYLKIW